MSVVEILLVSVGLSIDAFVAVAYIGAGFSKIQIKNMVGLCFLFGGMQLGTLLIGNLITLLPMFSWAHAQDMADSWEGLTVLIFAGLGIYMICKGIKRENVLERRQDTIDWKTTTILSALTSIDAFFAGVGLGFLDTEMICQALTLFPVTVLEVIFGIIVGYRLGLKHNRHAYWIGGALLLISSADVMLHYYV
ncbi:MULTISPECIES: manganese efflux pump MntP family protein [Lachnospiraceae]|uniref:manganese efflux pump MntP n=1 Tax=Lachnospiraceae TaxID=186803 RepID=UPI001F483E28|nr:manganese efflux pump [Faecalicatena contorta]